MSLMENLKICSTTFVFQYSCGASDFSNPIHVSFEHYYFSIYSCMSVEYCEALEIRCSLCYKVCREICFHRYSYIMQEMIAEFLYWKTQELLHQR